MKVGILGGGQLGRMIALSGYPLGLTFRFLDPAVESCVDTLGELLVANYDDAGALDRFVAGIDVCTYEFENVTVEAAKQLAERVPVYPPPQALFTARDRKLEKSLFADLGIATAPFAAIESREELTAAIDAIGTPSILKTRRLGYDGKGQFRLTDPCQLDEAWKSVSQVPSILEGFVEFDREVSIISVRSKNETKFYPLVENHHRGGILKLTLAPAPQISPELQHQAESIAQRVLDKLDYIGVLAIELFVKDNQLIANEMAPRVHNSGHWTIEGSVTSQFENHLRAILGMPLGSTAMTVPTAMINAIGTMPEKEPILATPSAHLHDYDKSPREGRKLGHVNLCFTPGHESPELTKLARDLLGEEELTGSLDHWHDNQVTQQ